MKTLMCVRFSAQFLLAVGLCDPAQAQSTNTAPEVSILFPSTNCTYNYFFGVGVAIKIKTHAEDPDGVISQVQFFADADLIGVVSNAPYSLVWTAAPPASTRYLKAVAVDNLGASTESVPIPVSVGGGLPTIPVFGIAAPPNHSVFTDSATFVFAAELLASQNRDTGPVDFFVGTNWVGTVTQAGPLTATTPAYSLTVTNRLHEGDYVLRVKKDGFFANLASCDSPTIRVTKLGMHSPRLTPTGEFEFDVVTSFPTNQNVIEASSNLLNWTPISTNVPFTNTFPFTDPSPATNSPRFYRAVVPSQ
jgi:hypothetical protein